MGNLPVKGRATEDWQKFLIVTGMFQSWAQEPAQHYRLGQLIVSAMGWWLRNHGYSNVNDQLIGQQLFYMEDSKLADIIREYAEKA